MVVYVIVFSVLPGYVREAKNKEDLIRSEVDLLCEPETSGLQVNPLCITWTSCVPVVASMFTH